MNIIHDAAPGRAADNIYLVMMPGATDRAQDLVDQGFVRALRAREIAADIAVVDSHFDYYLESSIVARLAEDVIAPARNAGHRRIWLMGISLGGMGALAYASERSADIEGMILLAPFLGARGLIAEITRAGGLLQWQPGSDAPEDSELRLLEWLRRYRADDPALPSIHLGYGTEDRYAPASRLLASRLPERQVVTVPGAHDWTTWRELWERLLDGNVFSMSYARPAAAPDLSPRGESSR